MTTLGPSAEIAVAGVSTMDRSALVQAKEDATNRQLGFRYLAHTSVTMFYRSGALEKATAELRDAGYHVVQADASRWLRVRDMHDDLSRVLGAIAG